MPIVGGLPPGWEQMRNEQGLLFYVNHNLKITQWDHPLSSPPILVQPQQRCATCSFADATARFCSMCAAPRPLLPSPAPRPLPVPVVPVLSGTEWSCSLCTLLNHSSKLNCGTCGTPQLRTPKDSVGVVQNVFIAQPAQSSVKMMCGVCHAMLVAPSGVQNFRCFQCNTVLNTPAPTPSSNLRLNCPGESPPLSRRYSGTNSASVAVPRKISTGKEVSSLSPSPVASSSRPCLPSASSLPWACERCTMQNTTNFCTACQSPRFAITATPTPQALVTWDCPLCTLLNTGLICSACATPQPPVPRSPPVGQDSVDSKHGSLLAGLSPQTPSPPSSSSSYPISSDTLQQQLQRQQQLQEQMQQQLQLQLQLQQLQLQQQQLQLQQPQSQLLQPQLQPLQQLVAQSQPAPQLQHLPQPSQPAQQLSSQQSNPLTQLQSQTNSQQGQLQLPQVQASGAQGVLSPIQPLPQAPVLNQSTPPFPLPPPPLPPPQIKPLPSQPTFIAFGDAGENAEAIEAPRVKSTASIDSRESPNISVQKVNMFMKGGRVWVEDSLVHQCMNIFDCGKKFSIHIRKHHCRCCGRIFCKDCCPKPKEGFDRTCRLCPSTPNNNLAKVDRETVLGEL